MLNVSSIISTVSSLLVCVVIAYLHGFERVSSGWNHRAELISVYSSEVVFRVGPCVFFAIATLVSGRIAYWRTLLPMALVVVSLLCAVGTYFTIETYVKAQPGKLMTTTVWDYVIGYCWLVAVAVCAALLFRWLRNPRPTEVTRDDESIR